MHTWVLRAACLGLVLAVAGCADASTSTDPRAGSPVPASISSPASTKAPPTTDSAVPPPSGPPPSGPPPSGPLPSVSTSPAQPLTPDSPITLTFGGDVHFEGRLAQLVSPDGLADLRPVLAGADVAVVNLETAITDRGTEQPKIYHFRTTPQALDALQHNGVDAVSMANNHAVDYGPDGLADTLAAQRTSPIPIVGIGADARQAFAPAVFTVRGTTVAVIASTQVNDFTVHAFPATDTSPGIAGNLDNTRLVAAVRAARAAYDVVVVYLHWGTDYTSCPDRGQVATATTLAAAGADAVVGGHAHRVQGAGWLGQTYVGYGLGNFVWLNTRGPTDAVSGVLRLTVDPRRARARRGASSAGTLPAAVIADDWAPLVIGSDGVPRPPSPAAARSQTTAWLQARACARLAAHP